MQKCRYLIVLHHSNSSGPRKIYQQNNMEGVANAFVSERLVYRAVEPTEDDINFLHTQLSLDPVNYALSDPGLLQPQARKTSEWVVSQVEKSLLGVMICLPAKAADPDESKTDDKTKAEDPKPTPIGFLVLGWGGPGPRYFHHHRKTELGISLTAPYLDKGYGSEAIRWALEWAFMRCNLHSVCLSSVGYNTRAHRAYEKVGFVLEGRNRESHWHAGKYWDVLNFSILDREWHALQKK